MAATSYRCLKARREPDACYLDAGPDDDFAWKPGKGVPVGSVTAPLPLRMSRRIGGKGLNDLVANSLGYLVVSERARGVLDAEVSPGAVEYLPARIFDHKARPVPARYFVANVIEHVDALDRAGTKAEDNPLQPGELEFPERIAADPSRIPPDRRLFRLVGLPRTIVAHTALFEAFQRAGLTGVDFGALELVPGQSRP